MQELNEEYIVKRVASTTSSIRVVKVLYFGVLNLPLDGVNCAASDIIYEVSNKPAANLIIFEKIFTSKFSFFHQCCSLCKKNPTNTPLSRPLCVFDFGYFSYKLSLELHAYSEYLTVQKSKSEVRHVNCQEVMDE